MATGEGQGLSGRPGLVTVPHPSQDIATGTLRSIYRQAGWEWK